MGVLKEDRPHMEGHQLSYDKTRLMHTHVYFAFGSVDIVLNLVLDIEYGTIDITIELI